MEEILESQMNSLKIKQFLDSAQKFTNEAFPDLNVSEMFKSSLTGNLNNVSILNYFAKIFSEEIGGNLCYRILFYGHFVRAS